MRHKKKNRILGRTAYARRSLMRALTNALLEHGSIVTTEARAKELRMFFEPLVTYARSEMTLHRRRTLLRTLGKKDDVTRLAEVAATQKDVPGGYVRITRLPSVRADAARMVRVEIVKRGK